MIVELLQQDFLVPNIDMDKEEITLVMEEFYKQSSIGTRNLSEIEDEYFQIQEEVDQDVYKYYGLADEEIKVIEKFIEDQAYKISRTT
jgi:Tfp pilus assembly PilM family ATPase